MAGTDFNLLVGVCLFLFSVWGSGRLFRRLTLPSILGEFLAGILLGPQFLDVVPFSSDGTCDTILFDAAAPSGSASHSGRALGSSPPCQEDFRWTPRWASDTIHTSDIWSFAGTVGVTLLIMESGMHINFEKVRQIGGQALIVAIVGTAMPLVVGMLLVAALFPGQLYPDGFAAGCALAPTSVGISIKLLSDAKMLNSMAGQTTLTAAFVDDVFSLVLLVLLKRLSKGSANPLVIVGLMMGAFAFLAYGVVAAKRIYPHLEKLLSHIKFIKGASIQPRDEVGKPPRAPPSPSPGPSSPSPAPSSPSPAPSSPSPGPSLPSTPSPHAPSCHAAAQSLTAPSGLWHHAIPYRLHRRSTSSSCSAAWCSMRGLGR